MKNIIIAIVVAIAVGCTHNIPKEIFRTETDSIGVDVYRGVTISRDSLPETGEYRVSLPKGGQFRLIAIGKDSVRADIEVIDTVIVKRQTLYKVPPDFVYNLEKAERDNRKLRRELSALRRELAAIAKRASNRGGSMWLNIVIVMAILAAIVYVIILKAVR